MSETVFTPDMTIADAIQKDPRVPQVFAMYGISGCALCHLSSSETLEQGCAGHGVDVAALITALNELTE